MIDALLETPEYAYYFANKWADVLRVKRRNEPTRAPGTFAFHGWIREAVAQDMPYGEFVRSILGATGNETTNPPTVWLKELEKPEQFVDDIAQVFLGQRLACAQCHHHPYEKWSQDDYWGLAAFFGRVGRKEVVNPCRSVNDSSRPTGRRRHYVKSHRRRHQQAYSGKPAIMKALDGEPMDDRHRRRSAHEARRLDGRLEEPVLREGRRQPLLGPLLRPRHRRSARRHARDQSAVATRNCSTLWRKISSRTSSA